ncbi:hypothetical protein Aam_030_045 [Acidocella aminolytica 101 = DSM 11237]|uniref:Uncharacterized protein n=2 Tax=Acidocella TaxID=50709 RepID=A0A0D6PDS5_9PROT|nr:hypothetical protein Aam_030_045 [Acidocella aminolytica 101 = DSM 11237]GBQ34332.1 hypothetical protein AA11237_0718 [Acidocella aminolytica 101 = DSM 11237]
MRGKRFGWNTIARQLGRAVNPTIRHAVRVLGLPADLSAPDKRLDLTEEQSEQIRNLAMDGLDVAGIADETGLNVGIIRNYCGLNQIRLTTNDSLPAGASATWGAIIAGTALAGCPFPSAQH